MGDSVVSRKSYVFAIRVVKLYKYLTSEYKEYVLSKQVLRSGTAIGALIREAKFAQSKADFISKMSIALFTKSFSNFMILYQLPLFSCWVE